jgi:hypothetical protein
VEIGQARVTRLILVTLISLVSCFNISKSPAIYLTNESHLGKFRRDHFECRINVNLRIEHMWREPHPVEPKFLRLLQNEMMFPS